MSEVYNLVHKWEGSKWHFVGTFATVEGTRKAATQKREEHNTYYGYVPENDNWVDEVDLHEERPDVWVFVALGFEVRVYKTPVQP